MSAMLTCETITKDEIDTIFNFFSYALKSDKLATLTHVEQQFIKQASEKLRQRFSGVGITFNKANFEEMVGKILGSMPSNQNGGVRRKGTGTGTGTGRGSEETQEVEVQGKQSFIQYDLYAIVAFLFGVFMLFLAVLQLNQMSKDLANRNIIDLSDDLIEKIKQTVASVPRNDLPLLSYVYNVFNEVCSNIGSAAKSVTMSKATNVVYRTFDNFNSEAISICSTKQTGVLGMMDAMVKAVVNLGVTSACVIEQQKNLYEKYTRDLAFEASKQMTSQTMALQNIKSLVVSGLGLSAPAVGYLKYRLTSRPERHYAITDGKRGGTKRSKKSMKTMKTKKRNGKSKSKSKIKRKRR
jgi:hypothetical protein